MSEKTFDLTENLPESKYSGLSELPEVKSTIDWLSGGGKGEFREMILDDVIPKRQDLPDWSKDITEKTVPEAVSKKVFYDTTGEGMNKIGEFFYTTKDAFANAIQNMPVDVMRYLSSSAKTLGISEEFNAELLAALDDYKTSVDFEKSLRDFRLGVESDAFSNEIASVFGQMMSILVGAGALQGVGIAGKTAAAVAEGMAEGGEYLSTDIAAQRQREGGLAKYEGEGLGFASAYGVLAGIIGYKGAEAQFLDSLGKFTGKEFIKEAVVGEALEEIGQSALERSARGIQNYIYGTDTDKQSLVQDLLYVGKNGALGAIGGASLGGIAYVNNHNRMKEMLVDNFGLTKADASTLAWQYLEDVNNALLKNSYALRDMSPDSRIMQFAKEQLIRDGQTEEQADKTIAKLRRNIIKEQAKKGEELSKHEFFEKSNTTDGFVEYLREQTGIHAIEDSIIDEEKQNIADRRAELEEQMQQDKVSEPTKTNIDLPKNINDKVSVTRNGDNFEIANAGNEYVIHLVEDGSKISSMQVKPDGTVSETNTLEEYQGKKKTEKVVKLAEDTFGPLTITIVPNNERAHWFWIDKMGYNQEIAPNTYVKGETQTANQEINEPVAQNAKPAPAQLELNFLNAQENAINQIIGLETKPLPVDNNLLTKQDVEALDKKIDEINTKLDEIKDVGTESQKTEFEVGKELNSFEKPRMAKSKYAERVAKQTKTDVDSPILHSVRDTKAAKSAADNLVESNENSAWSMLENDRADTQGLLRSEIAEALKRKIAKIQDPEIRKAQLRRLINAYADVATRAGQELRALADDSLVDAIRDAAQIEARASNRIKREVKNKSSKVKKSVDKVIKSNKVMSDKKLWDMIREQMECK